MLRRELLSLVLRYGVGARDSATTAASVLPTGRRAHIIVPYEGTRKCSLIREH